MAIFQSAGPIIAITSPWRLPLSIKMIFSIQQQCMADEMIFKRRPKLGAMLNSAIRLSTWTRSRPSWRGTREGTRIVNVVQIPGHEQVCHITYAVHDENRNSSVLAGYPGPTVSWLTDYFRGLGIRRSNELQTNWRIWSQVNTRLWSTTWRIGKQKSTEDQDERAKDAMIRYESRLDAYQFLLGKFENFKAGKELHDSPEDCLVTELLNEIDSWFLKSW